MLETIETVGERKLTDEQARAAYTLDRHVSVTAGPGAGKTTVLVERYLEILRTIKDVSVDQIVAITFTNRAANEMRTRLRSELDRLMRSADGADRARWLRHKRTLDGGVITTIHGFCSRLLRQFPIEAKVDPQFDLLDEHQTAMLEEAVAEEVLTELINDGDESIAKLTVAVTRPRLSNALIEMYRTTRNQGLSLDELATRTARNEAPDGLLEHKLKELEQRIREFIQMRRLTRAAELKRAETARLWPQLSALLCRAADNPDDSMIPQLSEQLAQFRERCRPTKNDRVAEVLGELDKLVWSTDAWGLVPRLIIDRYARKYTRRLIQALKRLEIRLAEEKQRLSALDFDDLQTKALELLSHEEVRRRAARGYRYYLVDEFQDTNGLQRDLLERFTLSSGKGGKRPNLFIVGDRKQSVYGFRGADVDVFREMSEKVREWGGESVTLNLNFRSQRPLVLFFNQLFEKAFEPDEALSNSDAHELGFVTHELGVASRSDELQRAVELLLDLRVDQPNIHRSDPASERDARQVVRRIQSLKAEFKYKDIALLFRAMTDVHVYEGELRRAGIPYLTVQGKGFYAREEVTDLIELLRFIDNRTDEIALAAVLRSPLCGLSDNALYALRCAPPMSEVRERGRLKRIRGVRPLLYAVRHHQRIGLVDPSEREKLDRAREFLDEMLSMRNRISLADLLRLAIRRSEYRSVVSANFDGAARLANVDKLLVLAERFEKAGSNLVRDFVKFVADFEKAGGRESEGQIDESADVVRLMTVHQSKGLEFPVVIIPELQRQPDYDREWYSVDRHRGISIRVPDGRGGMVKGETFVEFRRRSRLREKFESMRLLFVAATRARARLVLSGAAKDLNSIRGDNWLSRIVKTLDVAAVQERSGSASFVINIEDDAEIAVEINSADAKEQETQVEIAAIADALAAEQQSLDEHSTDIGDLFPLLRPLDPDRGSAIHRFSVTQLVNYQRCPRQYYFDRVVRAPTGEELDWWNPAESSEPPANLTATLRGAVIHHFCDKYEEGDDINVSLGRALDEVLRYREADLGERAAEIDRALAIADMLPLALNYLSSDVRRRVESGRSIRGELKPGQGDLVAVDGLEQQRLTSQGLPGVFSERRFRLRRPIGILTGTIDKLITVPAGKGLDVEIIDFKTNRFRKQRLKGSVNETAGSTGEFGRISNSKRRVDKGQLAFEFPDKLAEPDLLVRADVEAAAVDYRLQMQAYALAVRELIPNVVKVRVTLHFLEPDVEITLDNELLEPGACVDAIDRAATAIASASEPRHLPVNPAEHCRICSFKSICAPGQKWLRDSG